MKSIVQVNPTISAGFDFMAVDAEQSADALLHAGFQPDSRERTLGILPSVGSDPAYPDVSPRDAIALREWDAMRKAMT